MLFCTIKVKPRLGLCHDDQPGSGVLGVRWMASGISGSRGRPHPVSEDGCFLQAPSGLEAEGDQLVDIHRDPPFVLSPTVSKQCHPQDLLNLKQPCRSGKAGIGVISVAPVGTVRLREKHPRSQHQ